MVDAKEALRYGNIRKLLTQSTKTDELETLSEFIPV